MTSLSVVYLGTSVFMLRFGARFGGMFVYMYIYIHVQCTCTSEMDTTSLPWYILHVCTCRLLDSLVCSLASSPGHSHVFCVQH